MKSINDCFDKIYCINLDRATERWVECVAQFSKYNLNVERFSAIEPEGNTNILLRGELGILLSNYEIIKKAIDENFQNVLILEDDFVFIENFCELFDTMIDYVPEDWDFLYFGANHEKPTIPVNAYIHKMSYSYALHTHAVKHTMYERILTTIINKQTQIDVYYANMMSSVNAYVFKPHLSYQRPGMSYILNREVDYTFLK